MGCWEVDSNGSPSSAVERSHVVDKRAVPEVPKSSDDGATISVLVGRP